jgi:hypothetical protein
MRFGQVPKPAPTLLFFVSNTETKYKMSLKPNSIKAEYYLADLPGTLQYKKSPAELVSVPNLDVRDDDAGYMQVIPEEIYLNRLIPNTPTGRAGDWKLLLVFKREFDGEVWIKGALLNKKTNRIALMTTTNAEENITKRNNRAIKSKQKGWFVGHYRMGAPMVFWRAVAAEARKCLS